MNEELSHPDLYRRDGDSVALLGMSCADCGYVAFPRQRFGCDRCGAVGETLRDVELSSSGTLTSFATVHMHQAKTIAAPFVVGEVALEAGPTVRATMVERSDAALRIGARVSGRLVPAPAPPDTRVNELELRFALAEARK
jgi:uncharacterized OB-fold protein